MKTFKIKSAFLACVVIASVSTFTSCNKDNKIAPAPVQPVAETKKIEGSWTGKYGAGNNTPDIFFAANIKPSGVLEIKDKDGKVTGTGSWELTDETTFEGSYKYTLINGLTYTLTAKYDKEAGTLTGSWSSTIVNGGDFFWNKD